MHTMTTKEIWKEIPGFSRYEISTMGNIKSVKWTNASWKNREPVLLKPGVSDGGYLQVSIYSDVREKYRRMYIQRLMLLTFLPHENSDKLQADHINQDKTDNRLENLRWATPAQNQKNISNKNNINTKSIIQLTFTGDFVQRFDSIREAERLTGILHSAIGNVLAGRSNSSGGYRWKYEHEQVIIPIPDEEFVPIIIPEKDIIFPDHKISLSGAIIGSKGALLTPGIRGAYPFVGLSTGGQKNKYVSIHIMVAHLFVPGRTSEKYIVNHKDENKLNYRADNLEWASPRDNTMYSIHKRCKKVYQFDPRTGELLNSFRSIKEAIEYIGIKSWSYIQQSADKNILVRGFLWSFTDKVNPDWIPHKDTYPIQLIQQIDKNTGEVLNTFNDCKAACDFLNVKTVQSINRAAEGVYVTAYGYKWRYVPKETP